MSATRTYDVGDRPEITATFTNAAGTATDPTTVVFITRAPDSTEVSYTAPTNITNPTTGTFVFTFPAALTQEGMWSVRAKGTAGLITAGETSFIVKPSAFATP
jgi:hypothetical protein